MTTRAMTMAAMALAVLLCLFTDAQAMYNSKGPVKLLDAKGLRELQVSLPIHCLQSVCGRHHAVWRH